MFVCFVCLCWSVFCCFYFLLCCLVCFFVFVVVGFVRCFGSVILFCFAQLFCLFVFVFSCFVQSIISHTILVFLVSVGSNVIWFLLWVFVFWFWFVSCLFQNVPLLFLFVVSFCFETHDKFVLLFVFFCVFFVLVFCFFVIFCDLSKNISPKIGNSENPQYEKCRKKTDMLTKTEQWTQVRSQIVFFGVSQRKETAFLQKTLKIVVQPKITRTWQICWTWSKVVKKWSKHVAQHNWTSF